MTYFIVQWLPAAGKYERTYHWIMNKRFLQLNNRSTCPSATHKNRGEVYEDIGYFSYDGGKKSFMLRQFQTEGFINQFRPEQISEDGKTRVLVKESIENIPAGYRARETYKMIDQNNFAETCEIAEPGKDFCGLYRGIAKKDLTIAY